MGKIVKGQNREKVWKQSFVNVLYSRFFISVLITLICVIVYLKAKKAYPIAISLLAIPVIVFIAWYKYLAFESLLVHHSVFNSLGLFDWYSKVDDNLYLGALPIHNVHFTKLCKGVGVNVVVSVVESFELSTSIMLGKIVTPSDWKDRGVDQVQLSCPDFKSPPFSILDQGAEFINSRIINNEVVYVHCKSGRGRSASVIMAYFIRYRGLSADAAHKKLKAGRSLVFTSNSKQMKNILAYESYLRSGKKL